MSSLWIDRSNRTPHEPLPGSRASDVVVVGAGLTGLVSALLFARAGCSVIVLEGHTIGAGTTGHSTAKVSLLQGTRLSEISRKHSSEVVEQYVDANREGQRWLLNYCEEHAVPVQYEPAYTYASGPAGRDAVEAEASVCRAVGLDVEWHDVLDLPIPNYGAVRLDQQAQLDPMTVLTELEADLLDHGGQIFERTRATGLRRRRGPTVHTEHGDVSVDHVVVATGMPIFDRGGFFARLQADRSYALALRTREPAVHGMYLSADAPTRSLRTAPGTPGSTLLVGGNGHITGRTTRAGELVNDLVHWAGTYFPDAELTHTWSAQDYSSIVGLPYVGPLLPSDDRVLMATGFHKWGIANAVAAGLALSSRVLGSTAPWAASMRSWPPPSPQEVLSGIRLNGDAAAALVRGWAEPIRRSADEPAEGEGAVEYVSGRPSAVSTVAGETSRVSAICPHLGGIVRWNDAECSWDCPLHGSRFDATGAILEGPATKGLAPGPGD